MRMLIFYRRPVPVSAGAEARWVLVRAINAISSVVVGVIVLGILLIVLGANPANDIVDSIVSAARWLARPFRDLFTLHGHWRIIVNWGIAAAVYSLIAQLLATAVARSGRSTRL